MAVCIYQFPLFRSDKNKHKVSDQKYNCPHNNVRRLARELDRSMLSRVARFLSRKVPAIRS